MHANGQYYKSHPSKSLKCSSEVLAVSSHTYHNWPWEPSSSSTIVWTAVNSVKNWQNLPISNPKSHLHNSSANLPSLVKNHWLVCVEVLRPSQPNGVMSSAVSLPNHTFTGQALSSKWLTSIVHILSPEKSLIFTRYLPVTTIQMDRQSVDVSYIQDGRFCFVTSKLLFVLRFYGPVNPMGSCEVRSVYLTTRLLGRLSPLSG